MDWANPVEWFSWLYGKCFQNHPYFGGACVVTFCALVGLVLWIRGVDRFKEEHARNPEVQRQESPKSQAATANSAITDHTSVAANSRSKTKARTRPSNPRVPPTVSTSGSNSPAVGGITQGPGSIAQIGGSGNQATVNNLTSRPDPQLTEKLEAGETPDKATVKITVHGPMDEPAFVVTCDTPCESIDASIRTGAQEAAYYNFQGHPEMTGVGFIVPTTLGPGEEITWHLQSVNSDPLKVSLINRIPPEKIPEWDGKKGSYKPSH
jgi:hypothetical protein